MLTDPFVAAADAALTAYGSLLRAQQEGLAVDPIILNQARAAVHQTAAELKAFATLFEAAVTQAELSLASPEGVA